MIKNKQGRNVEERKKANAKYRINNKEKVTLANKKDYYNRRKLRYSKDPVGYLRRTAKFRAKKFNIAFSIETKDIVVNTHCPISNCKLDVFANKTNDSMSLDKVDNNKGYIKGNVQIISKRGNSLKNNMTLAQAKNIVKYMESVICQ